MAKIIGNTTATPNPCPDWNQVDETKADYIKNKPTNVSDFTNDSGYLTEHQSLDGLTTDISELEGAIGGLKFSVKENGILTISIEEE